MKTKLTLTVKKSIIEAAKHRAKRRGVSLSQLFEEIFEQDASYEIKTEAQLAADRLLKLLKDSSPVTQKNDKELLKAHVKRKFT